MVHRCETPTLPTNGNQKGASYQTNIRNTEGFKRDIVEQIRVGGKTPTQVSDETGIAVNSIYNWLKKYDDAAQEHTPFPGNGKVSSLEEELRQMRRRNKQLEEQIVILKKATAFFARETK
jgi:transposase